MNLSVIFNSDQTNLTTIWWIVGACAAAIIIVVVAIVLNKFVFSKARAKKILKELERKYEYLHALLTGQDSQYIQRLEIISRTNLLYMDIHTNFFRKFKEVRDNADYPYQDIIKQLGYLFEDNKIKEFLNLYKEKSNLLKGYENTINKFNSDLVEIIKPEEDARQASLTLKEKFREIKSIYNSKETELYFVSGSFQNVFSEIETRFKKFEDLVETAEYDEANAILPDIENVLKYLEKIMGVLPQIIKKATQDIPSKINEIKDKYKELIMKGYPLQNIEFERNVSQLENNLDVCLEDIKKLNVNQVNSKIYKIEEDISNIDEEFNNEISAKEEFDNKIDQVSNNFSNLEKSFIKTSNQLTKIRQIYMIDEEHEASFKDLKRTMDMVSKDKRRLEMYVHSKERTPYSTLKSRVNDLENGTSELKTKYNEFIDYIESLKKDSEFLYKEIKNMFLTLKDYESKKYKNLSKLNIKELDIYFDDCYDGIDEIYELINKVPIDVKTINEIYKNIQIKYDFIVKTIDENIDFKNKTIDNVMLMNRDRCKFSDINTLLDQVESLYYKGKYKDSYLMSESVLTKLKEKAGSAE